MDIFKDANQSINRSLIEKFFSSPGAEWKKDEYYTLNPLRLDKNIGSFSINDRGLFIDFATGESGDFIDLLSQAKKITKLQAAELIVDRKKDTPAPAVKSKPDCNPLIPIPEEKLKELNTYLKSDTWSLEKYGRITSGYKYRNEKGELLFCTVRHEKKGEKSIRPYCYDKDKGWISKNPFKTDIPLYGLERLSDNMPVLIVEGERCADIHVNGYSVISWCGGTGQVHKADWSILKDRKIIIWPDLDDPGIKAAREIKNILPQSEILDVFKFFPDEKKSYDIADLAQNNNYNEQVMADTIIDMPRLEDIEEIESPPPDESDESDEPIILKQGFLPFIVEQSEKALLKSNIEIYRRKNQSVRIAKLKSSLEGRMKKIKRPENSIIIEAVDRDQLTAMFEKSAKYMKYNVRAGDYVPADLPDAVARRYLSLPPEEWKLPVLTGLLESPTITFDGRIISKNGYDEKTGLYLHLDNENYTIPENPTRENALNSLEYLETIIKEFPFCNDEDQSVAIAAILTSLVRKSIKSSPLFGFTAPTMRSGKSMLADVVSLIATGKPAPSITLGRNLEENQKIIFSSLLAGDRVVCLDNIEYPLEGGMLSSVITQEEYRGRVLGGNTMTTMPTDCVFLATGNNLQVKGDMASRVLLCSLDSKMEKPGERKFERNLYKDIPQERTKLIEAALTILKAYITTGRPKQDIKPYGGFEDWSDWIRASLVWLNEADPYLTIGKIEKSDPVREQLAVFTEVCYTIFGSREITVSEIIKASDDNEDLKNILMEIAGKGKDINAASLGRWLKRYEGRIVNNIKIELTPSKTGNKKHYRIAKIDPDTGEYIYNNLIDIIDEKIEEEKNDEILPFS